MKWGLAVGIVVLVMSAQSVWADVEFLWATDGIATGSSTLYMINPTNGEILRTVGVTGANTISGLAIQPGTGTLYASQGQTGNRSLFKIDKTTGIATAVGTIGQAISDTAFRSDGTLYAWGASSKKLYTINLASGTPTQLGNTTLSTIGGVGLTFGVNGVLYLTRSNSFITVNTSNGTIASGPVTITGGNVFNMLTTSSTGVIYAAGRNFQSPPTKIYTLNVSTGALTLVSQLSGMALSSIACDTAPTPTLAVTGKKKITTTRPTITLKGTATSTLPLTITVKGKTTSPSGGAWSLKMKLKRGKNIFIVSGSDALGQSASGGRVTVIRK